MAFVPYSGGFSGIKRGLGINGDGEDEEEGSYGGASAPRAMMDAISRLVGFAKSKMSPEMAQEMEETPEDEAKESPLKQAEEDLKGTEMHGDGGPATRFMGDMLDKAVQKGAEAFGLKPDAEQAMGEEPEEDLSDWKRFMRGEKKPMTGKAVMISAKIKPPVKRGRM